MTGRDESVALLKGYLRDVATTEFAALVAGSDDKHVALPAAKNSGAFIGFEKYDSAIGDFKTVHVDGGVALARAAAAIAFGDECIIADAAGRIMTAPANEQVDVGLVPAANAAALLNAAVRVTSVLVTAGTVSGAFTLIPKGVAPTVTKTCSLSADGTKVNFLAADAVTAVTIEYEALARKICKALATAAALDDVIPVLILHGATRG